MIEFGYKRIVELFDKDETAGAFLREDGDGGFAAGVYRMAREIDRLRIKCGEPPPMLPGASSRRPTATVLMRRHPSSTRDMSSAAPQVALARAYRGLQRKDIGAAAFKAGVQPKQIANLMSGRPISADAFLRLAIAIGLDPMPDFPKPAGPNQPADLDRVQFAMAFRIARGLRDHSPQEAAETIGCKAYTIGRIERADVLSIGVVLRACGYIGQHVWAYCVMSTPGKKSYDFPGVSRETILQPSEIS